MSYDGYSMGHPFSHEEEELDSSTKFSSYSQMTREIERLKSFEDWKWDISEKVSPKKLAQAGFYYNPDTTWVTKRKRSSSWISDRCTCYWCSLNLEKWKSNDNPWNQHKQESPKCDFIRGITRGRMQNIPFDGDSIEKAIKFSQEEVLSKKRKSDTEVDRVLKLLQSPNISEINQAFIELSFSVKLDLEGRFRVLERGMIHFLSLAWRQDRDQYLDHYWIPLMDSTFNIPSEKKSILLKKYLEKIGWTLWHIRQSNNKEVISFMKQIPSKLALILLAQNPPFLEWLKYQFKSYPFNFTYSIPTDFPISTWNPKIITDRNFPTGPSLYLPDDLVVQVLYWLDIIDLHACMRVCQQWKLCAHKPILWRQINLYPLSHYVRDNVLIRLLGYAGNSLNAINLANCYELSSEALISIKDYIQLESIDFSGVKITDELLLQLAEKLHHLKYLKLTNCDVSHSSVVAMVKANPNLETLDISFVKMNFKNLIGCISDAKNLKYLGCLLVGSIGRWNDLMRCFPYLAGFYGFKLLIDDGDFEPKPTLKKIAFTAFNPIILDKMIKKYGAHSQIIANGSVFDPIDF